MTTLELFYDLVFVFAVTQVSHLLLTHLSWEGAGEALLVIWWSWNYTTWFTNEVDPDGRHLSYHFVEHASDDSELVRVGVDGATRFTSRRVRPGRRLRQSSRAGGRRRLCLTSPR